MTVDNGILGRPLKVVNIGLDDFARDIEAAGVPVVHLDWRPPASGNERLQALLSLLDQNGPNVHEVGSHTAGDGDN
jgi:hypothetical protein